MRGAGDVLADWYRGEIRGEATFWALAEAAAPDQALKWLNLAEVESWVARRLAEAIGARRMDIPECGPEIDRARARCIALRGKSWLELMQWLRAIAAEALHVMQADAATLPPDLSDVGALVVAHERALVDFADAEIAGRSESLRPVRDFLSLVSAGAADQHLLDGRLVQ